MQPIRLICILLMLIVLCGCSSYPLKMTEQEWNALTSEQQSVALERQKQTDKLEADVWRCRKESEKILRINIYGFSFMDSPKVGEIEVHLGEDFDYYGRCMERAGWKISPQTLSNMMETQ